MDSKNKKNGPYISGHMLSTTLFLNIRSIAILILSKSGRYIQGQWHHVRICGKEWYVAGSLTSTRSSNTLWSSPELDGPMPIMPSTVVQPARDRVVISPNVTSAVSPPACSTSTERNPLDRKKKRQKKKRRALAGLDKGGRQALYDITAHCTGVASSQN